MKETVLISGATGFLGSSLVKRFLQENYTVIGIKRKKSNLERLKNELNNKSLYLYNSDSDSLEKAFSNHNIDAVIHTACCYGRAGESFVSIANTNILFGLELLELTKKYYSRVFINTDTLLPKNVSTYALSKKQFTEWLKQTAGDTKIVNIKPEHLYGIGDDDTKFIGMLLTKLKQHTDIIPLTKGTQFRDFIYITDVTEAYMAVYKNISLFDVFTEFEVGTGNSIPVRMFVDEFIKQYKLSDPECKTQAGFGLISYRENELMNVNIKINPLRQLGWEAAVNYKDGIKKIINAQSHKKVIYNGF